MLRNIQLIAIVVVLFILSVYTFCSVFFTTPFKTFSISPFATPFNGIQTIASLFFGKTATNAEPYASESYSQLQNSNALAKRISKLEAAYNKTVTPQTTAVLNSSDTDLYDVLLDSHKSGFVHIDTQGTVTVSPVDLLIDTKNTLSVGSGGTGATTLTKYGVLYGNDTMQIQSLIPGNAGTVLKSNGAGASPSWIDLPSVSTSFSSLEVGTNAPFSINNSGKVTIAYNGDSGSLSSSGGAVYINNTDNIGSALGIFSNAGENAQGNMINVKVDNPNYAQAAFYMNYDGSSNAVEIVNNSSDSSSNALAVTGNDINDSTLGIIGNELAKGTIKVSHTRPPGGTDSNASGISVDLKGVGTRAQGIYVDSTESGGTLGDLLRLRNTSVDKFVVDYQGNVTDVGNIIQGAYGSDTTLTKYGNTTGDQFFVGTNGSFRVQRALSNSEAFRVQINGDTQGRWRGTSDGSLQWGDGVSTQDVILKRGTAGILWLTGGININNGNNAYNTVIKGVTDSNLLFVNASTNRIGIGTSTPDAALHIDKNALGNATFIINQQGSGPIMAASSSGTTVFSLDTTGNLRSVGSLCLKANYKTACAGSTPGTIYASNTTVQSADVAENYTSSTLLEPGDIVIPSDDTNHQAVQKSNQQYQMKAIGIISTRPGITLNSDAQTDEAHPYLYPIALQGRVYIKVSTNNGAIKKGDLLTTSDVPGVAMKATHDGPIVAKALEDYSTADKIGKIMSFVNISSYIMDTPQQQAQAQQGTVTIPAGSTDAQVSTSGITPHSHLFVQPEDVPIATAVKRNGDTFIIKIITPQPQDTILDWWLVN